MRQKIVDLIIGILEESGELTSRAIILELEERNCERTYDTFSKYFKQMTEQGLIKREAKGKKVSKKYSWEEEDKTPWVYHYSSK